MTKKYPSGLNKRTYTMKNLLVLLLIVFGGLSLSAQTADANKKSGFDKDRITFGGNFGLGSSNGGFGLEISPRIGYRVNERFIPGASVIFRYQKNPDGFIPQTQTQVGGGIWARYFVIPNVGFLASDFELVKGNRLISSINPSTGTQTIEEINDLRPSWFVGAGYYQRPINAFVQYDLLYNQNEYLGGSPFRYGIGIGF